MLTTLSANQARFNRIARENCTRATRCVLGNVAEADLSAVTPGRGEHNPTADLGLEPLPAEASQPAALREAVTSLSIQARNELYALMHIGQGYLAARNWHRGLAEAEALDETAITAAIIDDPDLHDHLAKALYEAKLAS